MLYSTRIDDSALNHGFKDTSLLVVDEKVCRGIFRITEKQDKGISTYILTSYVALNKDQMA